jgi:Fe-S-cluster containining protein
VDTVLDELGIDCNQCGQCCLELGGMLYGNERDLARWRESGRDGAAVLRWVRVVEAQGELVSVDLWYDPDRDEEWAQAQCPWVSRNNDGTFGCAIYSLRPEVCRTFPAHVEQVERHCIPGGLIVHFDA